jgi:hypothetical protein
MNRDSVNYWLHKSPEAHFDRELSRREAAVDADEHRDEVIAESADELYTRRMSELSDDDIICALQSANGKLLCQRVRDAIQKIDGPEAFGVLKSVVSCWIREDSETEAIKSMERTERIMAGTH